MDKDGYHGYDMSKLTVANTEKYKFHEPANNIVFYNTAGGAQVEVLRISQLGITANPDIPTDEAADAVIRALDHYLKGMMAQYLKDERHRIATKIDAMPFGDTGASFAIWIREGAV